MEEVGLYIVLVKWFCFWDIIFLEEKEGIILGDEFKGKFIFEEKEVNYNNLKVVDFFI